MNLTQNQNPKQKQIYAFFSNKFENKYYDIIPASEIIIFVSP